ncbi:MAG: hypothetical protein V4627_01280 [Pseudomonadota bacterium]
MKINFSRTTVLLCLLFTMGGALAARTAPLVEKSTVLDEASTRTPEQMRGYILRAADVFDKDLTYKVESDNPGALQLEFNKGNSHYVSVLFAYDHAGFKANYVSSKNLNYGESDGVRVIHPNYMVWIDRLIKAAKTAYDMQLSAVGAVTNPEAVAEVTFRSTDDVDTVRFTKGDETTACGKFEVVGLVANLPEAEVAAREKEKADWNAKYKVISLLGRRIEPKSLPPRSMTVTVTAARPLRISGTSSISVETGPSVGSIVTDLAMLSALSPGQRAGYGVTTSETEVLKCGPLALKFTPQGARKYAIEFAVSQADPRNRKCTQNVFDVTDPDKRVPVAVEEGDVCKK